MYNVHRDNKYIVRSKVRYCTHMLVIEHGDAFASELAMRSLEKKRFLLQGSAAASAAIANAASAALASTS